MDYDVELSAEEDVTFKDQKDGGIGIRVAGTMKGGPSGKRNHHQQQGRHQQRGLGKTRRVVRLFRAGFVRKNRRSHLV